MTGVVTGHRPGNLTERQLSDFPLRQNPILKRVAVCLPKVCLAANNGNP